jgi:hypothetical protein
MVQNSICFILPFFVNPIFNMKPRRFPPYFEHFLGTFRENEAADLKIFTNIPFKKYKIYENKNNILFYKLNIFQLTRLLSKGIGIYLNPFNFKPYKLCDFKPTFGLVFAEYLRNYEFWGYCDADMLVGKFSHFFTHKNLEGYDLITASKGNPGYMTLYRNSEKTNTLFQKSPDCKMVFKSDKNYRFDEKGKGGICALRQIVEKENIKVNNLGNLVHNDSGEMNQNRDWKYSWSEGILKDCLTGSEIGALHIVKSKRQKDFAINPFKEDCNLEITPRGINTV